MNQACLQRMAFSPQALRSAMCLFSASWLLDLKSGSWGFPECLGSPLQRYFVKCVNTAVCTRTQGGQSQRGDIRGANRPLQADGGSGCSAYRASTCAVARQD